MMCVDFTNSEPKHKLLNKNSREKLNSLADSHKYYRYQFWADRTQTEREDHKYLSELAEAKNREDQAAGRDQDMTHKVKGYRVVKVKKIPPVHHT